MRYTKLVLAVLGGCEAGAGAAARVAAESAQAELTAFITSSARRVHQRYGFLRPQRAADFVAEAPGHATGALLQHFGRFHRAMPDANASADPAAGWLYTVLTNHYHTLARKRVAGQLARRGGAALDPWDHFTDDGRRGAPAPGASAELEDRDFWAAPFAEADLRTVQSWRPLDAVVLMLLAGLHRKLPAEVWASLLRAAGAGAGVPSAAALNLPPEKQRDRFAAELGITRNHLDKIWSVKRKGLQALRFVATVSGAARRVA